MYVCVEDEVDGDNDVDKDGDVFEEKDIDDGNKDIICWYLLFCLIRWLLFLLFVDDEFFLGTFGVGIVVWNSDDGDNDCEGIETELL